MQSSFIERKVSYVICTEGKRSGARRVRDYSRPRRHRCDCCHASAWTQDRQHIQHHQQLPAVIRSQEQKEPSRLAGLFDSYIVPHQRSSPMDKLLYVIFEFQPINSSEK